MRALLIVNPHATHITDTGRANIIRALQNRLQLEVLTTQYSGHARDLAVDALTSGVEAIIVHGGDGTMNEVVNGLLDHHAASGDTQTTLPILGLIPGGNANVLARALGMPRDPMKAANSLLALIDSSTVRVVSAGRLAYDRSEQFGQHSGHRWFLSNAGTGLDATSVKEMESLRTAGRKATTLGYVRVAFGVSLHSLRRPNLMTLTLPNRVVLGARMIFVTNTTPWTYFGPIPTVTNPSTRFERGLGVFAVKTQRISTVASIAAQLLVTGMRYGNPLKAPRIPPARPRHKAVFRDDDVDELVIDSALPADYQVDGEFVMTATSARFTSHPNMVRVFAMGTSPA